MDNFWLQRAQKHGGFRLTREELKGKPTFTAAGGTHGYSMEALARWRGLHGDCGEIGPGKEVPTVETSSPAPHTCVSAKG